jgi:hypothetical protein
MLYKSSASITARGVGRKISTDQLLIRGHALLLAKEAA